MKTTKKNPVVAALLSAVAEHHEAQPHRGDHYADDMKQLSDHLNQ